jgi:hypothetical protein
MIDDEVEEFKLIRGERAAVQEFGKHALGSLPVESAHEAGEPAIGLKRGERSFVNASLNEDALKLL